MAGVGWDSLGRAGIWATFGGSRGTGRLLVRPDDGGLSRCCAHPGRHGRAACGRGPARGAAPGEVCTKPVTIGRAVADDRPTDSARACPAGPEQRARCGGSPTEGTPASSEEPGRAVAGLTEDAATSPPGRADHAGAAVRERARGPRPPGICRPAEQASRRDRSRPTGPTAETAARTAAPGDLPGQRSRPLESRVRRRANQSDPTERARHNIATARPPRSGTNLTKRHPARPAHPDGDEPSDRAERAGATARTVAREPAQSSRAPGICGASGAGRLESRVRRRANQRDRPNAPGTTSPPRGRPGTGPIRPNHAPPLPRPPARPQGRHPLSQPS
jgi:hypothetical protein